MDFVTKLERLMSQQNLNKHTLAAKCGIPYTTIVGLFERGKENARLSTVNRLCDFFNVPLDYLAVDEYENPEDFVPGARDPSIKCTDQGEMRLIDFYRSLNDEGKAAALSVIEGLANNTVFRKEKRSTETA